MEPKLHTYAECRANISLFEYRDNSEIKLDGRFANHGGYGNVPFCFYWLYDGLRHRTDGPAVIHNDGKVFWWFLGEFIRVKSQKEFDRWMINQMKKM